MAKEISPADLELYWNEKLGTGGGGQVVKGCLYSLEDNERIRQPVAVKVLDEGQIGGAHEQHLQNELHLLATALSRCGAVCKLFGYCIMDSKRCIVLELYECNLAELMRKQPGGKLPVQQVVAIGKQLAEALARLHDDANVAHFDVKPENVLIDKQGNCVLADFGIAHHFKNGETRMPLPHDCYGSERHMSPEQVKDTGAGISYAADVWSLACTLLHMATGSPPFPELATTMKVLTALMNGELPKVPQTLEPRLAGIIRTCLKKAPEARPTARFVRAQLSQLNAVLRIESGAAEPADADIPAEVLAQADVHPSAALAARTSASGASSSGAAPRPEPAPSAQEADLLGLMQAHSPFVAAIAASSGASPTSAHDLIDLGPSPSATPRSPSPLSDAPLQHHYSSAFNDPRLMSQHAALTPPLPGDPASRHPSLASASTGAAGANGLHESSSDRLAEDMAARGAAERAAAQPTAVVLTACLDGTMGVKCLFRSCNRVLRHTDDKMMGVALLPALDPARGATEAVSLTWWDLDQGCASMTAQLRSAGRAVAATDAMVVVGNEASGLSVWQFQQARCSSIQAAQAAGAPTVPTLVAAPSMQGPHCKSVDKVWDLAFEQPWLENPGGAWLAGASSGGCLALWDTTTWQQTFCAYAGSESSPGGATSVFSCCAMPGASMVAVACSGNQLVRVWDCRQPENVAAVMACDVPTDSRADAYIYCVSTVPSRGGHIPSQLLFGSNTGRLLLWDLRQPTVLWSLGKLSGRVLGCAASPCGRRIVAGSANGQVGMLDWTKPPVGRMRIPETPSAVALWECNSQQHPMYIFPQGKEKRMVLRAVCGNIVPGRLLSDAYDDAY